MYDNLNEKISHCHVFLFLIFFHVFSSLDLQDSLQLLYFEVLMWSLSLCLFEKRGFRFVDACDVSLCPRIAFGENKALLKKNVVNLVFLLTLSKLPL